MWKIAKKYGVDFQALLRANTQLKNPDKIMPGMKIKVPTNQSSVRPQTQAAEDFVVPSPKEQQLPIFEQRPIKEQPIQPPIPEPIGGLPSEESPAPTPVPAPQAEVPPAPVMPEVVSPEMEESPIPAPAPRPAPTPMPAPQARPYVPPVQQQPMMQRPLNPQPLPPMMPQPYMPPQMMYPMQPCPPMMRQPMRQQPIPQQPMVRPPMTQQPMVRPPMVQQPLPQQPMQQPTIRIQIQEHMMEQRPMHAQPFLPHVPPLCPPAPANPLVRPMPNMAPGYDSCDDASSYSSYSREYDSSSQESRDYRYPSHHDHSHYDHSSSYYYGPSHHHGHHPHGHMPYIPMHRESSVDDSSYHGYHPYGGYHPHHPHHHHPHMHSHMYPSYQAMPPAPERDVWPSWEKGHHESSSSN